MVNTRRMESSGSTPHNVGRRGGAPPIIHRSRRTIITPPDYDDSLHYTASSGVSDNGVDDEDYSATATTLIQSNSNISHVDEDVSWQLHAKQSATTTKKSALPTNTNNSKKNISSSSSNIKSSVRGGSSGGGVPGPSAKGRAGRRDLRSTASSRFVYSDRQFSSTSRVRSEELNNTRKRITLNERHSLTVYTTKNMDDDSDAWNGHDSEDDLYRSQSRRNRPRHLRSHMGRIERRTALSLRPISQKCYADPHSPLHFSDDYEGAGVRRSTRQRKIKFENLSWLADDQMHKVGYPNLNVVSGGAYSEEEDTSRDCDVITAEMTAGGGGGGRALGGGGGGGGAAASSAAVTISSSSLSKRDNNGVDMATATKKNNNSNNNNNRSSSSSSLARKRSPRKTSDYLVISMSSNSNGGATNRLNRKRYRNVNYLEDIDDDDDDDVDNDIDIDNDMDDDDTSRDCDDRQQRAPQKKHSGGNILLSNGKSARHGAVGRIIRTTTSQRLQQQQQQQQQQQSSSSSKYLFDDFETPMAAAAADRPTNRGGRPRNSGGGGSSSGRRCQNETRITRRTTTANLSQSLVVVASSNSNGDGGAGGGGGILRGKQRELKSRRSSKDDDDNNKENQRTTTTADLNDEGGRHYTRSAKKEINNEDEQDEDQGHPEQDDEDDDDEEEESNATSSKGSSTRTRKQNGIDGNSDDATQPLSKKIKSDLLLEEEKKLSTEKNNSNNNDNNNDTSIARKRKQQQQQQQGESSDSDDNNMQKLPKLRRNCREMNGLMLMNGRAVEGARGGAYPSRGRVGQTKRLGDSSDSSEEEFPKGYSLRNRQQRQPNNNKAPPTKTMIRSGTHDDMPRRSRRRFVRNGGPSRRRKNSSSSSDSDSSTVRHDKYGKGPKSPHGKNEQKLKTGAGGSKIIPIGPEKLDGNVKFSSIGGLDNHIRCLREMILLPMLYPEVFKQFGIQPPRGVLFHGPPGTGKTLIARALANECCFGNRKVSFFMRKGADLLSKWIGESEKQLRLLFEQAAEMQPSIIFFDELDGLAPVRSSRQDQVHASIVSTLLALMDGLDNRGEVIVIGATNRIDAIDPALRRPGRFDRELFFPLPAQKEREDILKVHVSQWRAPPQPPLLSYLAETAVGYCGSDLRALCTEAVIQGFRRTYPQVYTSEHRLLLDAQKVRVEKVDFLRAKSLLVPASQRVAQVTGRKLLPVLEPLLGPALKEVLEMLEGPFPHGVSSTLARVKLSPNIRPPHLLLLGENSDCGQTSHLAPAVLYKMEHIHSYVLDLATLYKETGRGPEETCIQVFNEARRNVPSVIYIPNVDVWWRLASETVRAILEMQLAQIDPNIPILFMATADCPYENLPGEIQNMFSKYRKEIYQLDPPTAESRRAFFRPLLIDSCLRPVKLERIKPKTPPPLPRAPTPPPEPISEEEERKLFEKEEHTLRELRIFLRDICRKLANNKLFFMFTKPVDTEEVPDYTTIIQEPMDLETMMTKVDFYQYGSAKDFLNDIELICQNALEYNPARTSADKQIRHRACTLRDYAYTLIKNEMDSDFEEKCQGIASCRDKRGIKPHNYLPPYIQTPDNTRMHKLAQQQQQQQQYHSSKPGGATSSRVARNLTGKHIEGKTTLSTLRPAPSVAERNNTTTTKDHDNDSINGTSKNNILPNNNSNSENTNGNSNSTIANNTSNNHINNVNRQSSGHQKSARKRKHYWQNGLLNKRKKRKSSLNNSNGLQKTSTEALLDRKSSSTDLRDNRTNESTAADDTSSLKCAENNDTSLKAVNNKNDSSSCKNNTDLNCTASTIGNSDSCMEPEQQLDNSGDGSNADTPKSSSCLGETSGGEKISSNCADDKTSAAVVVSSDSPVAKATTTTKTIDNDLDATAPLSINCDLSMISDTTTNATNANTTAMDVGCHGSHRKTSGPSNCSQSPVRRLSDLMSPSELLDNHLEFDDIDQALNEEIEDCSDSKPVECSRKALEQVLDAAVKVTRGSSLQSLLDLYNHLSSIVKRFSKTHKRSDLPKELFKELTRFGREALPLAVYDVESSSSNMESGTS